jgi:hypothetical protein
LTIPLYSCIIKKKRHTMERLGHEDVKWFIGTEVEHTPAFGKKTLFIVGIQDIVGIKQAYEKNQCEHIFFGANHSYKPVTSDEFGDWDLMIRAFTDQGILCSLDIPSTINLEWFMDGGLVESDNFIPQIRVVIPYIKQWNYNTMVKIDDKDFKASNPGVWTHSLHDLQDRSKFTPWSDYSKDEVIE